MNKWDVTIAGFIAMAFLFGMTACSTSEETKYTVGATLREYKLDSGTRCVVATAYHDVGVSCVFPQ